VTRYLRARAKITTTSFRSRNGAGRVCQAPSIHAVFQRIASKFRRIFRQSANNRSEASTIRSVSGALRRGQGAARGVLQDTADLIERHAREPVYELGNL
jgi:hypothetical protein